MSWYVLHLRSNSEKKVAEACRVNDIPYYLPLREETKIYQRRKVIVQIPLFRGYVFANVEPENRIHILRTNHVLRFLDPGNEGDLLHEIEQIRLALQVDPKLKASVALHEGARVRIKSGSFMGIEGVMQSVKGQYRVRLNVELVGQAVTLDVDRDYLEILVDASD